MKGSFSFMHELAIAQTLIDTATRALPFSKQMRVITLQVRLGPLAGVSKPELEFGFGVVATGTPFASARLEVEEIPVVVHCPHCQTHASIDEPTLLLVCPRCGATPVQVVQGKELTLKSFEVTHDPANL
jgi:hydrogenase nickel incorporation protein HypA/HybF